MDKNIEQLYLDNSEAGFASKLIAGVLDAALSFGVWHTQQQTLFTSVYFFDK